MLRAAVAMHVTALSMPANSDPCDTPTLGQGCSRGPLMIAPAMDHRLSSSKTAAGICPLLDSMPPCNIEVAGVCMQGS